MASVQKQARLQVVRFIEIGKSQCDDWRSFTSTHFIAQCMDYEAIWAGRICSQMTREQMAQPNLDVQLTSIPVSPRGPWMYDSAVLRDIFRERSKD